MLTFTKSSTECLTITTAAAVIVMMLHIVIHALTRSLFDAPIYGTNEIVEYWYLPIVALLGIPAAQLQKEHITVTMAIERAQATPPPRCSRSSHASSAPSSPSPSPGSVS